MIKKKIDWINKLLYQEICTWWPSIRIAIRFGQLWSIINCVPSEFLQKMANTLSVMTNVLRNVVSKQRIRYKEKGFNLDLACKLFIIYYSAIVY